MLTPGACHAADRLSARFVKAFDLDAVALLVQLAGLQILSASVASFMMARVSGGNDAF
jgi:hypothetical protein